MERSGGSGPFLRWLIGLPASFLAPLRSLWRGVTRRDDVEAEMREEIEHHIELRTDALVREGMSREGARRQAHLEFGHVETHRDDARASRGLRFFDQVRFSWLDVKLGVRMLGKHPGLTLAAVFALAVGIPLGMGPLHFYGIVTRPLPEDDADRIRAIHYWNAERNAGEWPSQYELERWREELTSFSAIGAVRPQRYSLAEDDGTAPPIAGAEATASTFDILGTPPLMGRALRSDDEQAGAPPVAVVGYDLWQTRLGADPDVIGSQIRVRETPHTIVGVMPEGFLFPRAHQLWLPLRRTLLSEPGEGPDVQMFGRLADGVESDEAQAEIEAAGQRLAADFPETNQRRRAEVVPWGLAAWGLPGGGIGAIPGMYAFQLICLVLLLVACLNVAMLIFARSATRFRELAIRTALGAGRFRIVTQMFVESLVLAVTAAAVGLGGLSWGLRRLQAYIVRADQAEGPTYWVDLGVTGESVAWALAFAVASAVFVSVLPALKVTGRKIQANIQRARAGRSGIRFGGVTAALIVADVAVAVTAVGFGVGLWDRVRDSSNDARQVGIAAEEFLRTTITLPVGDESIPGIDSFDAERDSPGPEFAQRVAETQRAVVERLEAEPWVRGVAVASELPRTGHESARVEIEGESAFEELGFFDTLDRWPAVVRADLGFFDGLGQPILAGRGFNEADLDGESTTAIVNTRFVDRTLGGRNALGRRIRFPDRNPEGAPRWLEIVGVVDRLGTNVGLPEYDTAVYLPAAPGELYPLRVAIHVAGVDPAAFAPRVRELVTEVEPAAVVVPPIPLSEVFPGNYLLFLVTSSGVVLFALILVAMAISGIYAILSFAVSERTREIAIRTALGAGKASIVGKVAQRTLWQIGLGAVLGMPLAGWLFHLAESGTDSGSASFGVALGAGIGIVVLIGFVSGFMPTRRALKIQPTEALRGVE